jgi:hypothetical protein
MGAAGGLGRPGDARCVAWSVAASCEAAHFDVKTDPVVIDGDGS